MTEKLSMPYVNNKGINIYYEIVGQGEPIIFHHPGGHCVQDWYDLGYVNFLKNYYQLILIDARGHGKSDKPHLVELYSIEKKLTDTIAVMDMLSLQQAICFGYSMGGRTAFALMKYYTIRFSKFIIGGVHPYGTSGLMDSMSTWLTKGIPYLVTQSENIFGAFPGNLRENYLKNDATALLAAYTSPWPDISDCLMDVDMSCLLFAGSKDPLALQITQAANIIKQAQLKILPGLNHLQVYWQAEVITDLILNFLSSTKFN